MSVLVLNLRKIQCAFWELLTYLLAIFMPAEKWAIVQQTLDKNSLKSTAESLGYNIHFYGSFSLLMSRSFDAIFSMDS